MLWEKISEELSERNWTVYKLCLKAGIGPAGIYRLRDGEIMENSLVGKYLEISGDIAGRIELENEKDLLVRRAIVVDGRIGLCEQAVYIDKKVLDNYWVKTVELSTVPETINSVDSTDLVRKWLNM